MVQFFQFCYRVEILRLRKQLKEEPYTATPQDENEDVKLDQRLNFNQLFGAQETAEVEDTKAVAQRDGSEGWAAGEDDVNSPVFSAGKRRNDWQIFTSHGLVLISILNNPGRTVREIGLELNLTDRSIALALADLVEDGYLVRERIGRRSYYHVNEEHCLRYPVSPFSVRIEERPKLTVLALRAENLATHAYNKQY